MDNQKDLEELYLQAKEAYYAGEPIMSDDEFDRLEASLREEGSEVVEVVGAVDRNLKFQHLSPMVSLAKAQADLDGTPPLVQLKKWFEAFPDEELFEGTPKYDGNAVNLIYVRDGNGKSKLSLGVTRGDKFKGRDVTKKLLKKVPLVLDIDKDVEVRGEVVIPMEIFNAKYAPPPVSSKNARNFIAGILGRDADDDNVSNEIEFMGVEVRIHDGDYDYPKDTQEFFKTHGFNDPHGYFISFRKEEFESTYYRMKDHREKESPFQLDGFVIKASETSRKSIGETGHHPNWAIAVKFPPKEGVTNVVGYKWNMGTTGEITPIVRLEPVDLDGTTIKNVAGFNLGHLQRNKIFPGAKVSIAKAGDIIPQIMKVLNPGDESLFEFPKTCPSCGEPTQVDTIHLWCTNEECEGKKFKKFLTAMRVLQMKKFGTVTVRTIYDCGFKSVIDIFDTTKFNKEALIATGSFKAGRTLDLLFEELDKLKVLPLFRAVLSLSFTGLGQTASKQIAKMLSGQTYSFSGLEKIAVTGFDDPEGPKRKKIAEFLKVLAARGVEVELEVDLLNGIGFEMTGSPKDAGYKVKSDFVKFMGSQGYVHTGLKEAKLLLTDSMSSSSSKMEAARKLGVEIKTYSQIVKELTEA